MSKYFSPAHGTLARPSDTRAALGNVSGCPPAAEALMYTTAWNAKPAWIGQWGPRGINLNGAS